MASERFDYVIVGGGTAGCVLAHRLSERGHRVCVLEAGPPDRNLWFQIPAGFTRLLRDERFSWQLSMEGSPGTNGRQIPLVQGRTLGGSSAVNGAIYSRGQALDFDSWAQLGNPGWGFEDLLPYFKRAEHYGSGDSSYRGRLGPIGVTETAWRDELCEAFIRAAGAAHVPFNADYNGASQAGVGYCQSAVERGLRWSTARGYLKPALRSGKVRVVTHALVHQIVVNEGRARSVRFTRSGGTESVEISADQEILLCSGAIHSPRLLQLSGIGPAPLLREHGIPIVHHLPGVGENLRDHYVARVVARCRPGVDSINEKVRGLPLFRQVMAWLAGRPSVLSISPNLVYAFCKSHPDLDVPDFTLSFISASYDQGVIGHLDSEAGLTCGAWQLRPESRGYVRLRSADMREQPAIQPNYLDDEIDQRAMIAGLKCARTIYGEEPLSGLISSERLPGPDVRSNDELLHYARQYGSTAYHVCGSCKMGPDSDPMAVVDAELKIRGIAGLRVVDASIMPTVPSANTCAATTAIAEKASDLILGR